MGCRVYVLIFIIFVLRSWAECQNIEPHDTTDLFAWVGEVINLRCENDPSVGRYWKKEEEILTMAHHVWTSNSRIESLDQSITLRINDASLDDEGQYTCVINSDPIHNLTFNLQVKEFTCEAPEKPLNGDFNGDSSSSHVDLYKVNDQIQYFCHRGFELVGEAIRTCTGPSQGWKPNEPSCEHNYLVRLQKSVDVIGNKMTAMESKMSTVENKITTMERKMSTVESKISTVENKITTMESKMTRVKNRITTVENTEKSMDNRMTTYENKCPNGFVKLGDKCYYFSTNHKSWFDALKVCLRSQSTLAFPSNSREISLLREHVTGRYSSDFWIGGTDDDDEDSWVWTHDQSPIYYTDWFSGEPNDGDSWLGDEDCLSLRRDYSYRWDDAPCGNSNGFICQLTHVFDYD